MSSKKPIETASDIFSSGKRLVPRHLGKHVWQVRKKKALTIDALLAATSDLPHQNFVHKRAEDDEPEFDWEKMRRYTHCADNPRTLKFSKGERPEGLEQGKTQSANWKRDASKEKETTGMKSLSKRVNGTSVRSTQEANAEPPRTLSFFLEIQQQCFASIRNRICSHQ